MQKTELLDFTGITYPTTLVSDASLPEKNTTAGETAVSEVRHLTDSSFFTR